MRPLVALCAAGAILAAAPALADTMYNPSNGQTYTTTATTNPQGYIAVPDSTYAAPQSGYVVAQPAYDSGPMTIVTAPVGMLFQPANGAIGSTAGEHLVPYNPHCFVQTDFNGRHTAMCGP